MKSLKLVSPHQINVEDVMEDSEKLKRGYIRIRINRISLCGSDYKLYEGLYGGPHIFPIIFGHEWSGEVAEVALGENDFKVGDYVTGDCSCWCGKCENCKRDKNICKSIEKFGITLDGFSRQSVVVNKKYIYRSEKKLSFKALALVEPFAVSLHALKSVNLTNLSRDSDILVQGCGVIGIAAYLFLTDKYGFRNVYISDINQKRFDAAKKVIGKRRINCINLKAERKQHNTYSKRYLNQGFDYIFEASGTVAGLDSALEETNPFGIISYVGLSDGELTNSKMITMKKLTIQGSIGGTGEFDEVIRYMEENSDLVEKLVTYEVAYDNASILFHKMGKLPDAIKCQLLF